MPIDMLEEQLETDTYDVGTLVPGITVYGSWESDEKIYQGQTGTVLFCPFSSFSVSIINKNKAEISKEKSLGIFLCLMIKMIDNL